MTQQAINPCVCGKSVGICPVHPPIYGTVPSTLTVPLGAFVKPWGKCAMVGWIGGERYYWFVRKDGSVSMIDSATVGVAQTAEGETK